MPLISPVATASLYIFLTSSIRCCYLKRKRDPEKQREMWAETLERDDSFKKPGAIPFKWEIRPGVPKHLQHQHHLLPNQHLLSESDSRSYSLPTTPHRRLTPPPPSCFTPPPDLRTSSFHSMSKLRSNRHRVDPPLLTRPDSVSTGCFLTPWFRRKWGKKKSVAKPKMEPESEPDYTSELETIARWSISTRRARSPMWDSLSSSSFSSHRSSPRPVGDSEWAGFALF